MSRNLISCECFSEYERQIRSLELEIEDAIGQNQGLLSWRITVLLMDLNATRTLLEHHRSRIDHAA